MFNIENTKIQNIDHLGIVAGIVDSIGLVEIINNFVPQEQSEKVSAGHVVKAMILNGLGFVAQPLYMFPKYFETIPCEHLLGEGIKPEYLNDYKLGRVMDKLFIKGLSSIFLAISINVIQKFKISTSTSHLDSSSMHVHGEYKSSFPEVIFEKSKGKKNLKKQKDEEGQEEKELGNENIESKQAINITYGYSRDHRPDLKQFLMQLISSGDGDIPIFFQSASGNQVDSSCFGEIAANYKKQINFDSLVVADCALYTEQNIEKMSGIKWLSRVPLSINEAKLLVSTIPESEFLECELKGYLYVAKRVTYAGVEQRWLVVQSQERKKSDLEKLSKKIVESFEKTKRDLKKLSLEEFACEADAVKALSKLSEKFKYHQILESQVTTIKSKKQKLPSNQQATVYQISATFTENEDKINQDTLSAGRFILATNVLSESELPNSVMICEYKAQQSCERGFSFLKNPSFFADSVYLKSPERIEALAMIMGLSLLVYTLAQRQIRLALYESQLKIKNQLGKLIDNPTLKWIFQCFQSIHLVTFNDEKQISNWNQDRDLIIKLFLQDCHRYYQVLI
ncbi:IS4 family transposase [Dulcicalothrix desertica PCC 7102]|uniref:IS4 family transposase n=1 Tax=Dulcicalothrix desertica PCC 7102 TaxID=232991 RepID=A0A3S1I7Z3_9CYAN|nr:IS1634 family transposase [Dulcicalothrix desertica]RUS93440.1 IS4 family transposase [Dulcicalothrix desertica PCC 7102]TWH61328.1 transposase [Dulcicalothrix desertica PCC 7102]